MTSFPKTAPAPSPAPIKARMAGALPLPVPADENPHLIARQAMPTWTLLYVDRRFGLEKQVEYEAVDVAEALTIAGHEPIGREAELSRGGELVCRIGGEPDGAAAYWVAD